MHSNALHCQQTHHPMHKHTIVQSFSTIKKLRSDNEWQHTILYSQNSKRKRAATHNEIKSDTFSLFLFIRPDVSSIITLRGRESAHRWCCSDLEKKALIHSVADWSLLDFLQMWYNTRHSGYIMGIGASKETIKSSDCCLKLVALSWRKYNDDMPTNVVKKKNMSS